MTTLGKPMGKAPRDGSLILAWNEDLAAQNPAVIYWECGSEVFDIVPHWRSSTHEIVYGEMFTHWIPLPLLEVEL